MWWGDIKSIRRWLARRRLERIIEANANSYETRRFRERRAAALKGARRC